MESVLHKSRPGFPALGLHSEFKRLRSAGRMSDQHNNDEALSLTETGGTGAEISARKAVNAALHSVLDRRAGTPLPLVPVL